MTSFELILAASLAASQGVNVEPEELACLTRNIYFEARGESREGQIAVAYVTLNRVAKPDYGNTICAVVYEDSQFSWTEDGLSDRPKDKAAYALAMLVALDVLRGRVPDPSEGATHFYNPSVVSPGWARQFAETAVIDQHRFMRE